MSETEPQADSPVWDLVAEFLERREQGRAPDPEAFIRAHAEWGDRLRDCLAGFRWMDANAASEWGAGERLPRRFGSYELVRVIGHGGMGCVYEAVHVPLGRRVALKVLPPHLTHLREFRLRFLREARVVASLHHTHIAPVFEVGQIGNALYLAMPFIQGPNLRELLLPGARGRRPRVPRYGTRTYWRWAARIGLQAAEALAHAHGRGVIHRDVKPSNLIVDEAGAVWVVDFGLAKAALHPAVTLPGELIGTLRYASPEQLRGEAIDARSDVYSLGVTLYELITGGPAFPPGSAAQVLAAEPLRPRAVSPHVPLDLEKIVLCAMAKRLPDRYPSAASLADDLRRFLRDEPVRARPVGPLGRLTRWCRRNPAVSLVAAAAALVIAALAGVDHVRLVAQRNALAAAMTTQREQLFALLTEKARRTVQSNEPGRSRTTLGLVREASRVRFTPELWELAIAALDQLDATLWNEQGLESGRVPVLSLDVNGRDIVGCAPSGQIDVWHIASDRHCSLAGFGEPLVGAVWVPGTSTVVGVAPSRVWIGDFSGDRLANSRVIFEKPATVACSPDGAWIALWDSTIAAWHVPSGTLAWERPAPGSAPDAPYQAIAWSPDGRMLAAARRDEARVELWSMPAGELVRAINLDDTLPADPADGPAVASLAFSSDSQWIACACADGAVRLLEASSGRVARRLARHAGPVRWVAFAPAGWIASADAHEIWLRDAPRGELLGVLVRSREPLRCSALDPKGNVLVTADQSGRVRTWRLPSSEMHEVVGNGPSRVTSLVASREAGWIAWADEQGYVAWTESAEDPVVQRFPSGLNRVRLAASPDGRTLAIAGWGKTPILVRAMPGGETKPIGADAAAVEAVAFIGRDRLATAHADGTLAIWNPVTAQLYATLSAGALTSLAASSDGRWLAGGAADGTVHLWDASMHHSSIPAAHAARVRRVAFAPDNASVASAAQDGTVRLWRLAGLTPEFACDATGVAVTDLAFCLDGALLACSGEDRHVALWSRTRGARIGVLTGLSPGPLELLAASADGRRLFAAGGPRDKNLPPAGGVEAWDMAVLRREISAAGLPEF